MTTNIEDIYNRYPSVRKLAKESLEFYMSDATYDPNEESCFDRWVRIYDSGTDLYNFLYALSDYDGFLLKENEIIPEDYIRRETALKKVMTEQLGADLDDIWWMSEDEDTSKWPEFYIKESDV